MKGWIEETRRGSRSRSREAKKTEIDKASPDQVAE